MYQERTAAHLDTWMHKIKQGDRAVTSDHENLILRPISDMIRSTTAWSKAMTNPGGIPPGCFTSMTAKSLEEFWKSRSST